MLFDCRLSNSVRLRRGLSICQSRDAWPVACWDDSLSPSPLSYDVTNHLHSEFLPQFTEGDNEPCIYYYTEEDEDYCKDMRTT